ncbi:MAG: hypothetical protein WCF57_18130 [Pyrinomonadaceae bacterium]
MRRFAIHLALALTTFLIGMTTTFIPSDSKPEAPSINSVMSRGDAEDELRVKVFQLQIEPHTIYPMNTYYLSCYNYVDPSDKIMARLTNDKLVRVKKLSEFGEEFDTYPQTGIFVRVGSVNWISDTEVIVGASSAYNMYERALARVYRFRREAGGWILISSETIT